MGLFRFQIPDGLRCEQSYDSFHSLMMIVIKISVVWRKKQITIFKRRSLLTYGNQKLEVTSSKKKRLAEVMGFS